MFKKHKSLVADDTLFMAMLLVLVGVLSFGLGQRSVGDGAAVAQSAGVVFIDSAIPEADEAEPAEKIVSVVGSRSGTKYHLPSCPGAAQIKEANKLFFDSRELAEAAGYTPAANCPGL